MPLCRISFQWSVSQGLPKAERMELITEKTVHFFIPWIFPVPSWTQTTRNVILKFIFREEYIALSLQKNHLSVFGLTKMSFEAILFCSVHWIARTWGLSWMFVTAAIGSEHWRPLQCAYDLWGQRFMWLRQREREQKELGNHWNTETVVKLATGAQVQPLRPLNLSA